MHIIRNQLVFAGLLAVFQLGHCNPISMTVSKLMELNKSDRFGLAKYFKEFELSELCNLPIVDDAAFKRFEENNNESSCLCTVIYHMTKELEESNYTNKVDLESMKKIKININDKKVYAMWKNVTKVSPSLKLLMDSSIDDITKWNTVCYNEKEVVTKYCHFLNLEVLLLNNTLETLKESPKEENIVNRPVIKKTVIPSDIPKEPKISDNPPKTNDIGSFNESNIDDDVQKPKDVDKNNDEDIVGTDNIKDMETISDDELNLEKQIDTQITTETEIDTNDYPKESDGEITHTINKETQLVYSQKSFTNHRYSSADDSHFLFYFGIMTIISMLFYLALYNKKKNNCTHC